MRDSADLMKFLRYFGVEPMSGCLNNGLAGDIFKHQSDEGMIHVEDSYKIVHDLYIEGLDTIPRRINKLIGLRLRNET